MLEWIYNLPGNPYFQDTIFWVTVLVIMTGMIQNFVYAWCLPQAWMELNKHSQREDDHGGWEVLRSSAALPISIIVPAHNEANTIRESVMALLALQYPDLHIIVVNDGSADATADTMITEFKMTETYVVRDTETISHLSLIHI